MIVDALALTMLVIGTISAPEAPAAQSAVVEPALQSLTQDTDPWSLVDLDPTHEDRKLRRHAQTSATGDSSLSQKTASASWMRTSASLAAVVALIGLLAWGYRAVTGGSGVGFGGRRRPGCLEVVSRTALGPRQSLCLVRVGPRLVLVGMSKDALHALDVIDDESLVARLLGETQRAAEGSNTAEFDRCLEREARSYQDESEPKRLANGAERTPKVRSVREQLADTLQRVRSAMNQA